MIPGLRVKKMMMVLQKLQIILEGHQCTRRMTSLIRFLVMSSISKMASITVFVEQRSEISTPRHSVQFHSETEEEEVEGIGGDMEEEVVGEGEEEAAQVDSLQVMPHGQEKTTDGREIQGGKDQVLVVGVNMAMGVFLQAEQIGLEVNSDLLALFVQTIWFDGQVISARE